MEPRPEPSSPEEIVAILLAGSLAVGWRGLRPADGWAADGWSWPEIGNGCDVPPAPVAECDIGLLQTLPMLLGTVFDEPNGELHAASRVARLEKLGFAAPPPPLTYAERLSAVVDVMEALVYLHTRTPRVLATSPTPAPAAPSATPTTRRPTRG